MAIERSERVAAEQPEPNPNQCFCCGKRDVEIVTGLHWWKPSPGFGYGMDGAFISLCHKCISTLRYFVEIQGPPPAE